MDEQFDFDVLNFSTGWHDDPAIRAKAKAAFNYARIDEVMGVTAVADRPAKVDLTRYLVECHGPNFELHQGVCGSCVAHGYAIGIDILEAIDHVENGAELPPRTAPEPIYWASRNDIGGGRLWGAGSVGAWAAEAVKKIGVIPHGVYGTHDLTKYDATRCCSHAARQVLPEDLKTVARKHTVKEYAAVTSWKELINALASGYPVPVCSNQGFAQHRDEHGIAEARGVWGHCMCIVGYDLDLNAALIVNSWGPYFTGGGTLNAGCFYARQPVVDRMLRQDDTFAISNIVGWPRKKLDLGSLNF